MKDNQNISMRGHIKVTSNKYGVLYDNNNTIGPDALEILLSCLYQGNNTNEVDKIKAIGDFGTKQADIFTAIYNHADKSITFRAVFYEFDFNGTINELQLLSNSVADNNNTPSINGTKKMASKNGLSIFKDGASRVQIDWKININLC